MESTGVLKAQEVSGSEGVLNAPVTSTKQPETASTAKAARVQEKKIEEAVEVQETEKEQKVEHIAKAMDEYVQSIQRDLKIQVHGPTGHLMVKVVSKDSGKTIREIPSEEVLNLAAKMEEMMGVLFNENV